MSKLADVIDKIIQLSPLEKSIRPFNASDAAAERITAGEKWKIDSFH